MVAHFAEISVCWRAELAETDVAHSSCRELELCVQILIPDEGALLEQVVNTAFLEFDQLLQKAGDTVCAAVLPIGFLECVERLTSL